MNEQPESLRLAGLLELAPEDGVEPQAVEDAAAELLRLHAENESLRAERERNLHSIRVCNEIINKKLDENETLRTGYAAARLEIESLQARIKTMAEEHADELTVAHLDGRMQAAQPAGAQAAPAAVAGPVAWYTDWHPDGRKYAAEPHGFDELGVILNDPDLIREVWHPLYAAPTTQQASQQEAQYDHGPQAETVAEAARDVGKWLNERPNRPLDLRHVAMLAHHATAPQQEAQEPVAWQSRTRPTWGGNDRPWSPWEPCTKGQAEDCWKTPLLHDWAHEARALYTAPQPSPASQGDVLDTVRLDWMGADEGGRVFHLGKSWYTRSSYGMPCRKQASLREAIDAARAAQEGEKT